MKFFETKKLFSKPKIDEILFESIKSFAVRHLHLESAPSNIGNSKKKISNPSRSKRKSSHLSSSYFRLIDSNNMSSRFGFEKMFFVSKNFIRLGF